MGVNIRNCCYKSLQGGTQRLTINQKKNTGISLSLLVNQSCFLINTGMIGVDE